MSPPILHKNFDILKSKIIDYLETTKVNKRVGPNTTYVTRVIEVTYDPNVPILTKAQLLKKLSEPSGYHKDVEQIKETTKKKGLETKGDGDKKKDILRGSEHERRIFERRKEKLRRKKLFKKKDLEKRGLLDDEKHTDERDGQGATLDGVEDLLKETEQPRQQQDQPTQSITSGIVRLDSSEDDDDQLSDGVLAESADDAFVINFDDEYRDLDSSDDDESEIAKNLKKIRPHPSNFKQPNNASSARPRMTPNKSSYTNHVINGREPPNSRSTAGEPQINVTSRNEACQQVMQQAPVDQEPDWKQLLNDLDKNNFDQYRPVYQHLNHFKDKVKSSSSVDARELLKAITLKCFAKDESFHLMDFLDLIYECDIDRESKYISQVFARLKRKINPHATVHLFKSKVDVDVIMNNYRLAMKRLAQDIETKDLELEMRCSDFKFLMEMASESKPIIPMKKEEPRENMPPPMTSSAGPLNGNGTTTQLQDGFAIEPQTNAQPLANCQSIGVNQNDEMARDQHAIQKQILLDSMKYPRSVQDYVKPDGTKSYKVTSIRKKTIGNQLRKRL